MHFYSRKLLLGLSACLLAGAMAQADSVIGAGNWQPWSAANLVQGVSPTPGLPYWNNFSGDGSRYNIGWCLAGGGNCNIPNPPGNASYFGTNGGAAPSDISFVNHGYPVIATLDAAITNSGLLDTFGWYSINADGSIGSLHRLFSQSSAPGITTLSFTPSHLYGLYVEQDQGAPGTPFSSQYFFFTNSSDNRVTGYHNPGDSLQHFAVFDPPTGTSDAPYYIGAVDTRACTAGSSGTCDPPFRFDYNDFVVKLDTLNTPEPGSLGLVVSSLILFAAFVRLGVLNKFRKMRS